MNDINSLAKQQLSHARNLISTKGWTKGTFARNAEGKGVSEINPTATCFCMLGAINNYVFNKHDQLRETAPDGEYEMQLQALWDANEAAMAALRTTTCDNIPTFNDAPERTVEEVLAAFDAAIASI